jgi:hypothetical protein
MDGQGCECLSSSLRKANVRKAFLSGRFEDVLDAVWNIVESKFINGKVPEFDRGGRAVNGFLGVFVATVVSKLDGSLSLAKTMAVTKQTGHEYRLTQTSKPRSTSSKGKHLCSSVRQTQTSEFISKPWCR